MERKSAFRQLLEAASWRGRDATGIACVKINKLKEPAVVYKKAIKAGDFIDMDHYRRIERNFDDYGFVIGHARSSTSDGWNLADENAHPFQFGPVTMVHNGTIRNYRTLDSGIEHPVDSAHVAACLSKSDDPKEVLEQLMGPFALVWHDARDGTLNFAKNNEKPLFFCFIEKENTMFWGSELEAMYAVLVRHGLKIEGKFRHCTAFHHVKFKVDDLRGFTRSPFAQRRADTRSMPYDAPWREETRRLHQDRSYTEGGNMIPNSTIPTQEKSGTSTGTPIGSLTQEEETGDADGVIVFRKGSLRPQSRRKLRSTKEKLLKLGKKIDSPICFVPELWYPYKNQKANRGAIRGRDRVRNQWFEIGNTTKKVWEDTLAAGKIYGKIVNVKRNQVQKNEFIIVCDYDEALTNRFALSRSAPGVAEKPPFPINVVADGGDRKYLGPNEVKLTEKEFNTLVKHGCGYCSRDLSPEDHETILWVGPHMQSPICWTCSSNQTVKDSLGLGGKI
ncbi:MAG: hypothetical protein KGL39_08785 [Patescibacteria group bacterium]|nr:hypothetical protein [Patescibacteria group bacterium]